jgi:mannose-6-phosphate isomerase
LEIDMPSFNDVLPMKNAIQNYGWGSRTAIAELCGAPSPSDEPEAELWMGAHPKAPSEVFIDGQWSRLDQLIADHPMDLLGDPVATRFSGRMPFLFKVLAAAEPLSIQAHPSREQAELGFQKENEQGIPVDAPHRNYRDASAKPEIICALTPFWGMNGFRGMAAIRENLQRYCPSLFRFLPGADNGGIAPISSALKDFFHNIMALNGGTLTVAIRECLERASSADPQISTWIRKLNDRYPGDVGVLSPLWLNLVCLSPGEAMFLPAGQLHAYLAGTGIELMANSDNVLRGGLTPKHVDVPELMRVLQFSPTRVEKLACRQVDDRLWRFDTPADEFTLSVIRVDGDEDYHVSAGEGIQILFAASGRATLTRRGGDKQTVVNAGASVLVPAAVKGYRITGDAVLYAATVAAV